MSGVGLRWWGVYYHNLKKFQNKKEVIFFRLLKTMMQKEDQQCKNVQQWKSQAIAEAALHALSHHPRLAEHQRLVTDCLKEGTGKREPQVGEPSDIPDDAASGKTKKRTGRSFNQKGIVAYKKILLVVDKKVNYRGANEHWCSQLHWVFASGI